MASSSLEAALAAEAAEFSEMNPNTARLAARGVTKDVMIPDLTVAIKGHELLTLATLRLMQGHRYGLVGANGIGKTTLLRRIAAGQIAGFPSHLRCHLVQQEVAGSDKTALQTVIDSDTERTALLKQEAELTGSRDAADSSALDRVYELMALIDADSAEARAAEALDELGFSQEAQQKTINELSGGWRMRVSLAQAVYLRPDILLLDEPSNHLDLMGVIWLTSFVNSLDSTVLIVSHDAQFLTDCTTDIIHFRNQQLTYYQGNFDQFIKTRTDAAANTARQQKALDSKREHIRESIDKMKKQARSKGHPEQKLGGVASRQKKLGRMGFEHTADGKKFNAQSHGRRIGSENDSGITSDGKRFAVSQIEPPDKDFKFSFPQPDLVKWPDGTPLLSIVDMSFGYNVDDGDMDVLRNEARELRAAKERAELAGEMVPVPPPPSQSPLIFSRVSLFVRAKDKIGLIGANGLGKSTLLKLLYGDLTPCSGEITRSDQLRISFFSQHLVDQLDLTLTPVGHLFQLDPQLAASANSEQAARAALGRFGLGGKLALQPIGTLSGGQKARLVFASITLQCPQILILDEPTNFLDFITIDALTTAVQDFEGAVILVSHDQALLEQCNQLYLVDKCEPSKVAKVNPNQLKSLALKKQKEKATANKKALASVVAIKLDLPSKCSVTKLDVSFSEYREQMMDSLASF